jgi:cellulose synthase/poly-beta-1,6-N-acetylglucosamine synthase-like glycosyltransferase
MNVYNIDMTYITLRYIFWWIIEGRKQRDWELLHPGVTIQLPIYNENPLLIRKILYSISNQDYPKNKVQIVLVDQSDEQLLRDQLTDVVERFKKDTGMDTTLLFKDRFGDRKTTSTQFVAGALNLATQYTIHDLIAIVAGDSYLHKDFLKKSIRHFQQNDIGFVCTLNIYTHNDFIARLARLTYNPGFLFGIMKARMKFPHFAAGNGMLIRKGIIDEIPWDTNCEDVYLSMMSRIKGWNVSCEKEAIIYNTGAPVSFKALKKATKRSVFGITQGITKVASDPSRVKVIKDIQLMIHMSPPIVLPLLLFLIPINLVLFSMTNIDQNVAFLLVAAILIFTALFIACLTIISTWMFGIKSDLLYYPLVLISSFIFLVPTTVGIIKVFIRKPEPFYRTQREGESNPRMDWDIKSVEAILIVTSTVLTIAYLLTSNLPGTGFFLGILLLTVISLTNVKVKRKESLEMETPNVTKIS